MTYRKPNEDELIARILCPDPEVYQRIKSGHPSGKTHISYIKGQNHTKAYGQNVLTFVAACTTFLAVCVGVSVLSMPSPSRVTAGQTR